MIALPRDWVNSGIGIGIVRKSIPIPELELDLLCQNLAELELFIW